MENHHCGLRVSAVQISFFGIYEDLWGLGFRVSEDALGCGVTDEGSRAWGLRFGFRNLEFQILGFRIKGYLPVVRVLGRD